MDCERYAIWWVPQENSPLARFGSAWTGWCPERGSRHKGGALSRFADLHANLPASLRLGGLHAPIGPSFRLAEGRSPWALERALAELATSLSPITLSPLRLELKDSRVRLTVEPAQAALTKFTVKISEALRSLHGIAPIDGAANDYAARKGTAGRQAHGSDAADAEDLTMQLCFWLSGSSGAAAKIIERLTPVLAPILAESTTISDLALICDPGGNRPWR